MEVESSSARIEQLLSASRAIYIIDSTGILLHHEFFLGQDDDPDLYSGLFTAVNVYAKELKAGNINAINLEDHKFVFKEHEESGYLIVLDVNTQLSDDDGVWLLKQILKRFEAIQNLLVEDFKGSLTLETLFDERGKNINWGTIQSIREDALERQKSLFDKVDTLNLTKININNKIWVKIRKIVSSLVENQKGLIGTFLILTKKDHINELYSGRDRERIEPVRNFMVKKLRSEGVGLELETEKIQMDDLFCAIYPLLSAEGGYISIASIDKYLITRLNNQMERLVAAIDKLGSEL